MQTRQDVDVRPLFTNLVDDAGLFPPARLPMEQALARHRADVARAHPVHTHRFLCAASRIDELQAALADDDAIRLGVIVDGALPAVAAAVESAAADLRLELEAVEVALPADDPARAAREHAAALRATGVPTFVELPRVAGWRAALDVLAAADLGAKVRCGGVRADLFPTIGELTAFVTALVAAGVPWKATAGLHHAVRYRDPRTGFDHHGFVNLLVAVCRAIGGGDTATVAEALRLSDHAAIAAEVSTVDSTTAHAARRSLIAYGSCDTAEPVDDLVALGLIDDRSCA